MSTRDDYISAIEGDMIPAYTDKSGCGVYYSELSEADQDHVSANFEPNDQEIKNAKQASQSKTPDPKRPRIADKRHNSTKKTSSIKSADNGLSM